MATKAPSRCQKERGYRSSELILLSLIVGGRSVESTETGIAVLLTESNSLGPWPTPSCIFWTKSQGQTNQGTTSPLPTAFSYQTTQQVSTSATFALSCPQNNIYPMDLACLLQTCLTDADTLDSYPRQ